MAAVRDAGLTRIDYLLITHLHEDHNGGVAELQRRLPIGTFIDYGSPMETAPEVVASFAAYAEARRHAEHWCQSQATGCRFKASTLTWSAPTARR